MKLYHKVADGAKVRYYDFTSLYPTVYSQKTVSVWTPQINNRDFGSLDKYFGFVKFDVLPQEVYSILSCPIGVTKKTHVPVLSDMCWGAEPDQWLCTQWQWDSCQVCGSHLCFKKQLKKDCEHWRGVAFSLTKQTHCSRTVKTILKCKQEASGYPGHVKMPEEDEIHIEEYFKKEGIQREADKICVNKAVTSCYKVLLNSLWGRFSMQNNLPTCELITESKIHTAYVRWSIWCAAVLFHIRCGYSAVVSCWH